MTETPAQEVLSNIRTAREIEDERLARKAVRTKAARTEEREALQGIVDWWDSLPPNLRQDIEGSGAEPGVIAIARRTAKGK